MERIELKEPVFGEEMAIMIIGKILERAKIKMAKAENEKQKSQIREKTIEEIRSILGPEDLRFPWSASPTNDWDALNILVARATIEQNTDKGYIV